ncbi:hypothetical protein BHF68_07035 [Desulfuribacillus alkaliarsenatis]|uniref:O-antigen ligase-related domain-containing protein n=2 Tax=Desulfuribacillus alkaliarsenatis TaxID=766136 RepID=A0A1E5G1W2_9FIRM|nr:hypothetical protein BHF68_07035 [Desulfuribacillus alkaliarsenatis]
MQLDLIKQHLNITTFLFILFFSFPVVDYVLRSVIGIGILAALWHNLVLALLLVILGWRWLMGEVDLNELKNIDVTKPLLLIMVYGFALIFLNMSYISIGIEGFRATFQYMLAFFVAFYLIRDRVKMLTMIYIMVGIGFVMGLHGVYQYIAGVPMPGNWVDAGENVRTRAFSFVGSPNVLGSYMAFIVPITIGLAFWHLGQAMEKLTATKTAGRLAAYKEILLSRTGLWSLVLLGMSGVMALCLLLTFSRGALLAFGAAVGVVAVIFALMYDRRMIFGVAGLAVVGVGVIYMLAPTVVERMLYVFSPEYFEKSAQGGRVTRWLNAFDRMRHEPFFGAGLGHYGGAVGARHFGTIYVDNYYAKTLAEMGLIGIGLFLWLIGSLLKNCLEVWKSLWNSSYKFIAAGLFGGLLAVILHNGVENIFEVPFMNVLFWMSAGMLIGLGQEVDSND